jgi:hypothetical protein
MTNATINTIKHLAPVCYSSVEVRQEVVEK